MPAIIEETRQHAGKQSAKHAWWQAHGVAFDERARALPSGDYTADGSNILVDTKASIDEIMGNLGAGYRRLDHECRKAADAGYRLVFVIEAGAEYADPARLSTVPGYVCRRCWMRRTKVCDPCDKEQRCTVRNAKPFQGYQMVGRMKSLHRKYGAEFEFVDGRESARRICELLGVAYDE